MAFGKRAKVVPADDAVTPVAVPVGLGMAWHNPGNPKQHDWEHTSPGWKCKRPGCGAETMFVNELRELECGKA